MDELFQKLDHQIKEHDLLSIRDSIRASALPSAFLALDSGPTALSQSFIFGSPMLPDQVDWPTNSEGWPLMHVAQIDFEDLMYGCQMISTPWQKRSSIETSRHKLNDGIDFTFPFL